MLVKIGKHRVDVADSKCGSRPCYQFGFDKGTYAQGRGYTSYYDKPKPVCMARMLHGCPSNSVCDKCRRSSVEQPGGPCPERAVEGARVLNEPCGGTLIS